MQVSARLSVLIAAVLIPCPASAATTCTDVHANLHALGGWTNTSVVRVITKHPSSRLWALGGEAGECATTTDFVNYTDCTTQLAAGGLTVRTILTDGTTWAFAGGNDTNAPLVKHTTDFVTFTDRAAALKSALGNSNNVIWWRGLYSTKGGTNYWMFPSKGGNFAYSTDGMATFVNLKANLGCNSNFYDTAFDGTTWVFVGTAGCVKSTTDLSTFTDLNATVGAGVTSMFTVSINGSTSAIGGTGFLKASTDGMATWTDRRTEMGIPNTAEVRQVFLAGARFTVATNGSSYFKTTTDFTTDIIDYSACLNWATNVESTENGSYIVGGAGRLSLIEPDSLAARVSDFDARTTQGGNEISWLLETPDVIELRLERALVSGGPWDPLLTLQAPLAAGPYSHTDASGTPDARYRLSLDLLDGTSEVHGPVSPASDSSASPACACVLSPRRSGGASIGVLLLAGLAAFVRIRLRSPR